jgi:hypothetical protein
VSGRQPAGLRPSGPGPSAVQGTVRFGLDGAEYEIDLNAGRTQLRDALAA